MQLNFTPLALLPDRSDTVQKLLLRCAASGPWRLRPEIGGLDDESYHNYTDALFASIGTIEGYKDDGGNNVLKSMLYSRQKSLGHHPCHISTPQPSTITAAFANE